MKTITLASQKGGCGKSTVAMNLAINLALKGNRVVLFDTDPQQSCVESMERRTDKLFEVVPAIDDIHQEVESRSKDFDYAVIDTPPHDDEVMGLAIVSSDMAIIPVQDSPLDIRSSKVTVDLVLDAMKLTSGLKVFFLLSRIQPNTVLARELRELMAKSYSLNILESETANRVAYKYSMIYGLGVTEMDSKDSASQEVNALTDEVIKILSP